MPLILQVDTLYNIMWFRFSPRYSSAKFKHSIRLMVKSTQSFALLNLLALHSWQLTMAILKSFDCVQKIHAKWFCVKNGQRSKKNFSIFLILFRNYSIQGTLQKNVIWQPLLWFKSLNTVFEFYVKSFSLGYKASLNILLKNVSSQGWSARSLTPGRVWLLAESRTRN